MGAKWRAQRKASLNPTPMPYDPSDTDPYEGYVMYDPSWQQFAYYLDGTTPMDYMQSLPGPRSDWHPETGGVGFSTLGAGDMDDHIDYEIGGQSGAIDNTAYAINGPVTSDGMENFWLSGETAIIRRGRNPADHGPVGTSDSNALLSVIYDQLANQYYPNEASQADLVRSV